MPSATAPVRGSALPPEERFWQRYSPHHEFSLSSASSVAIHILALVMVLLVGRLVYGMMSDTKTPLREIPVTIEPPGGGGVPGGQANDLGRAQPKPIEDIGEKKQIEKDSATKSDTNRPKLNPEAIPILPLPAQSKDDDARLIKKAEFAHDQLTRMANKVRDQLRAGVVERSKPGPGKDGSSGRDKDSGPGDGEGPGPGSGKLSLERMDRWVLVFDTESGDDYARQLYALGAILAVPRENSEYAIIRDLSKRPAVAEPEDIAAIKRIWWEDNKPDSIAALCSALGIKPIPDHVVAFFPESLERKLLKIELQYQGLREHQIKETRFRIRKTADGYEPVVVSQKAK
jgi:hypothetical protein